MMCTTHVEDDEGTQTLSMHIVHTGCGTLIRKRQNISQKQISNILRVQKHLGITQRRKLKADVIEELIGSRSTDV